MTVDQIKNLQIGDIVRLKSGGPEMVVLLKGNDNHITCAFWSPPAEKIVHTSNYPFQLFDVLG